ncbi:MAG: MFS transporter [Alphaproteobacteria bacterium MedPE-SWcel]|nr:MAG: MFS transporter [Alphaproteobacteria bacterium MedPE-SWcel]
MSKSLSQVFLPAFGGTALLLAAAVFLANRQHAENKLEMLQARVETLDSARADARRMAAAEAGRAEELAQKVAEIEAAMADRAKVGGSLSRPAPAQDGPLGLGRSALAEEIHAWDVDILPDGRGLPEGRGDVFTGEEVFAEACASCHGDFAEGVDNWPVLAGGFDTLADKDPVKTVGSYWPYLSTVWDYVHRSMPFGDAQSLSNDDVYAIVAYILYSNDLVDDEFELSHENFAEVRMHNADGFVVDDRPSTEYPHWTGEPCMANCKETVAITKRATFLNVTPESGGDAMSAPETAPETTTGTTTSTTTVSPAEPAAAPAPTAEVAPEVAPEAVAVAVAEAPVDAELVKAGEKVFRKCKACHTVGTGAKNKTGPQLNALLGRQIGAVEGFRYSKVFQAAREEGRVWDEASLIAFLAKPKSYLKGTKMAFSGLKKKGDQEAIIAYLNSFRGE